MLHSVARAVVAAVLLIGDLSERRGLWRSDAAGAAQCGSGEAALRFLPVLSPSFLLLIFFLLSPPPPPYSLPSFYGVLSFYIFLALLPLTLLQLCCSPPLLRLVELRFARLYV